MSIKALVMKKNKTLGNGRLLVAGLKYEVGHFYREYANIVGMEGYPVSNEYFTRVFDYECEGPVDSKPDCFSFISEQVGIDSLIVKKFCMEFMCGKEDMPAISKKYKLGLMDIKNILHFWDLWVGKES